MGPCAYCRWWEEQAPPEEWKLWGRWGLCGHALSQGESAENPSAWSFAGGGCFAFQFDADRQPAGGSWAWTGWTWLMVAGFLMSLALVIFVLVAR